MPGIAANSIGRREIPPDVAVEEWDTPPRAHQPSTPINSRILHARSQPQIVPDNPLDLLTSSTDSGLSFVVRDALDDLLLNVIRQLQHDLNHGPASTRSKIASQFLPKIMKALDNDKQDEDVELNRIREEMEKLNHEMLHGEPKLYAANSTYTPDSDDLPIVDPRTGKTVIGDTEQQSA